MKAFLTALGIVCFFAGSASAYQPAPKPSEDDVAELMMILNETTSTDTFVITLQTLVGLEPERKGLISTVIKNADRLGLLKGLTADKQTAEQELISEALEKMVEARNGAKNRNARPVRGSVPTPVGPVTSYRN